MARKKKAVEVCPEELALVAKYPAQVIVPGSWRAAGSGDRPGWGCKRTVVIRCAVCESERVLATSDLFQVKYCKGCAVNIKANKASKGSK